MGGVNANTKREHLTVPQRLLVLCINLSALATDAAGQLHVLRHDCDTLGMDGAEVSVLEQTNKVALCSLLESHHGAALEAQIGLVVLRDLTHKPLKRQLADEQLRRLLVLADLTAWHCAE